MNAFVNIPDNNLSTCKVLEVIPPWFVSGTPKKNGLVSNICSLLPSSLKPEMAVNSVFSAPKFKPRSLFDLVDKDSPKVNVNLISIQSLPSELAPKSTPSDVGNGFEAGDCLCLFLGPLSAVPSIVPPLSPPGPPVSVEELQTSQGHAKNEGSGEEYITFY
ncbi:hypothetical protein DSO57_1008314 [Entomophthora muscae]|uniref:Uncharacterized protein n=1 Tax=Entomophthora muscae TaxID=34485 RepID=A0ACC2RLZ4_9FUNG|nr:hypothetical protein DSO57_1008314 [Entomophthora muscae]